MTNYKVGRNGNGKELKKGLPNFKNEIKNILLLILSVVFVVFMCDVLGNESKYSRKILGINRGHSFALFMLLGGICCFYKSKKSKESHPNDDMKAFGEFVEYKVFIFFAVLSFLCAISLYLLYLR